MDKYKKGGWIVLVLLLVIISLYFSLQLKALKVEADNYEATVQALELENQQLAGENEALNNDVKVLQEEVLQLSILKEENEQLNGRITDHENRINRSFELGGHSITVDDVRQQLVEHPEIIDIDPVLGGTMFFLEEEIFVLSDQLIFANFEDGHIMGYALIKYRVEDDQTIFEEVLFSNTY